MLPIGYATGTTGGVGGSTVTVTTKNDLQDALSDSTPRIVQIDGIITGTGSVYIGPNKTIIGINGGTLDGIGLYVFSDYEVPTYNIIIQNLTIRLVRVIEDNDNDCINIKFGSHHIWIDHCDIYNDRDHGWDDYYDGLVDAVRGCNNITISWCKIHDNHVAMLMGGSAQDVSSNNPLFLTMHHNYIYNNSERNPDTPVGYSHIFNNYFKNISGYGCGILEKAEVLLENNYFENCYNPILTTYDNRIPGKINGLETNIYKQCTPPVIRNIKSTWKPDYKYQDILIPAKDVPNYIVMGAGVQL